MPVRWPANLDAKGWAWARHRLRSLARLRGPVPRPALLQSRLDTSDPPQRTAPTGPLRLLACTHSLRTDGAPTSLFELLAGLIRSGDFSVEVLAFEDGPLRARYEALGIPVRLQHAVQFRVWSRAQLDREVASLAQTIRASGAELVLANTLLCFAAVLAAEEAGQPSVWIPRESEPWQDYFRFLPDPVAQRAIGAIGLPRAVVFVAEATRQVWHDFDEHRRFHVVPNGLDLSRFAPWQKANRAELRAMLGWPADDVVFLCAGTVCARKGQADLVEALERSEPAQRSRMRVVLVGDASDAYAQHLKRRAHQRLASSGSRVEFIDARSDIGHFYRASDAFVLSSRVESYPRVTLEAMAFGLPLIATPVFGVTEQLREPDDALFYRPADTVALAGHMQALMDQPLRHHFGECSRAALVRLPDHAAMCQRYRALLWEAVRRPGSIHAAGSGEPS